MSEEGSGDLVEKLQYTLMGAMLCGSVGWALVDSGSIPWFSKKPVATVHTVQTVVTPLTRPAASSTLVAQSSATSMSNTQGETTGSKQGVELPPPETLEYDKMVASRN